MNKFIIAIFFSAIFCTYAEKNKKSFLIHSPEITTAITDTINNTGSAILTKGRLVYYKCWQTQEHTALEVTLLDNNYTKNDQKNWFDQKYLEKNIIWLAKISLVQSDYEKVLSVFNDRTYKKELGTNKEIIFHIPETSYSEFFFVVQLPGDFIEQTTIKLRYVMNL